MSDKQATFRERIERLEQAARCLDDVAATIADEVARMAAVEKRFAEQRRSRRTKASSASPYQPHQYTQV